MSNKKDKPENPEKVDLRSLDVAAENREKLKELFPSVFTETKNEQGELVESIDIEKLKAELGTFSDIFESRRERYGMDWPGKKDCMKIVQQASIATLKPCRDESVNFDTTENLFIEGDNLEVLKLLQKSFYNRVKMIYIDPPYNTGHEFIYPDKYSESIDTYLVYAGLVNDEGKHFSSNTENEGRFHTKWLNMMYPRLYLARNLLKEDGAIFISIDDNEVNNLKMLCNDIFGEENFIASIIWQKVFSPKNTAKYFSEDHDYIVVYARNKELWAPTLLPRTDEANNRYDNPDNDPRGPWSSSDLTARNYYSAGQYEVTSPAGKKFTSGVGRYWRSSYDKFLELDKDNRIWWGANGASMPRLKRFLSEVREGIIPQTLWDHKKVGHTQEAKKELIEYVNFNENQNVLNSVKPTRLLQRVLQVSTSQDTNDIVMDFFAGSAPLAHAVMKQNREDSGNRKYICVQIPEPLPIPEKKLKTIADIGKERVQSVINAFKKDDKDTLDLETRKTPEDLGFKVLKLDRSNFKIWEKLSPDAPEKVIAEQLTLHVDHINESSSQEDILFELLLKAGFMPTEKVEKIEMTDKTVFSIAEGALLICLEDEITSELINAVAEAEPMQFYCLDSGFHGNDQLKANAVQTFAAYNQGREKTDQIIFRTV